MDAMRDVICDTKPTFAIDFIVGVIAIEPINLTFTLESQDMGGYPIEEPAIMADDDGTSGEGIDGLL